jgi:hypothetical protein
LPPAAPPTASRTALGKDPFRPAHTAAACCAPRS